MLYRIWYNAMVVSPNSFPKVEYLFATFEAITAGYQFHYTIFYLFIFPIRYIE